MAAGGSFSQRTAVRSPLTSKIPAATSTGGKQRLLWRSISQIPTTSDPFDGDEVSPLTLELGFRFLFGS
jgi:hypothetical protein